MSKTVFWSWQSDLDGRVTREVVRSALDGAIKIISADLEEADRPSLTSDTQGIAGTPDIVATILRKIDEAAVFVGDVTPIAVSDSGKSVREPKRAPRDGVRQQIHLRTSRHSGVEHRF